MMVNFLHTCCCIAMWTVVADAAAQLGWNVGDLTCIKPLVHEAQPPELILSCKSHVRWSMRERKREGYAVTQSPSLG